jgi:hypothetical protein
MRVPTAVMAPVAGSRTAVVMDAAEEAMASAVSAVMAP